MFQAERGPSGGIYLHQPRIGRRRHTIS